MTTPPPGFFALDPVDPATTWRGPDHDCGPLTVETYWRNGRHFYELETTAQECTAADLLQAYARLSAVLDNLE